MVQQHPVAAYPPGLIMRHPCLPRFVNVAFISLSFWQVWSRGKHNLHALWDRLLDPGRYNATAGTGVNLRKAARVVVTGASAGVLLTWA